MRCFARNLLSLGLAVVVAAAFSHCRAIAMQVSEVTLSPVASLEDQLEKGLRARRGVEFQFVGRVAQLVDQGRLSKELVQGSFSWTVKKYRERKSLVPYFEQVLRQRAKKEGNTVLDNVPTTLPST